MKKFPGSESGAMVMLAVFGWSTQHLCFAVLAVTSACVHRLPPAAPPPPVAPPQAQSAAATPPQAGNGRLVVDVTNGAAPVQRIRMDAQPINDGQGRVHYRLVEAPGLLCSMAPCITEVPIGNVLLGFPVIGDSSSTEVELVNVGPGTSVYRRTLSEYHNNTGAERVLGIIATSLGGASAITGTVLLPVGLADHNSGLTTAGAVTLGGGAALLAIGILMIRHDAPTYRPGSSNHFSLR